MTESEQLDFIIEECERQFPHCTGPTQLKIIRFSNQMVHALILQRTLIDLSVPQTNYTAFKIACVKVLQKYDWKIAQKLTGIGRTTLYRWRKEYHALQVKSTNEVFSRQQEAITAQGSECR